MVRVVLAACLAPAIAAAVPDVTIWTSPRAPAVDRPLRLVALGERDAIDDLVVRDAAGTVLPVDVRRLGGPPWSVVATVERPAGWHRVEAMRGGIVVATRDVLVAPADDVPPAARAGRGAWASERDWDAATEAFYAAWIEHLFDAPADAPLALRALEEVLRDPARNLLHDHLRLGEDGPGDAALDATPDCADLPYLLRAYFAWKLGLPAGFRACDRGSAARAPRCAQLVTNEDPAPPGDALAAFRGFLRRLADTVQSGSARTAAGDDATDLYPVPLTRAALRPGTVYADPYGHTLVVVKWVPQTPAQPGLLLAVDAQPDDSVGRKRFWEGTFLFASDVPGAGAGFKAFRPLRRDPSGVPRPVSNGALADDPESVPFSEEQADLTAEAFHARVARLVNPDGLDPIAAYEATLDALVEQLETRVRAVEAGERHVRETGSTIAMPEGARIFETIGPWEDYATPARDLRLLIAMQVLLALPDRVVEHPELFVLGERPPTELRDVLAQLHDRRTSERAIEYRRSDGSPWRLTVAELLARRTALEVAYDPNDCVEVRWGAPVESVEAAPCRRRAPAEHRARMERYRVWFHELRRPAR